MKLKISEIKNVVNFRNDDNCDDLVASIKEHGLLEPVVVNENNELVGGYRRIQALQKLKMKEVPVHRVDAGTELERLTKTLIENLHRRAFTWQEEALLVKKIDDLSRQLHGSHPQGKHSSSSAELADDTWSTAKTAKILNKPERTVQIDVQLAKGIEKFPELLSVNKRAVAYKKMLGFQAKETLVSSIQTITPNISITKGDCIVNMRRLNPASIDLIFIDFPTNQNYESSDIQSSREQCIEFICAVLNESNRLLKQDGSIYVMPGVENASLVYGCLLQKKLSFQNWIIWHYRNSDLKIKDRFIPRYEPILFFTKSKTDFIFNKQKFISDLWIIPRVTESMPEKVDHPTQRPTQLLEIIVQTSSNPGNTVLDPMCGSGTTAVACNRLKRNFIGFETEQKNCELAKLRISEEIK
ncbi:MAG: hypothetical protein A2252_06220 [Elusimicrobia bacterium RIFOXYA2_FULL_39_19]|nr:MAG: hypothetical protein A2252_06220 [Elusimicrobia bacterium RIFOXYA2_FULL_39_19]